MPISTTTSNYTVKQYFELEKQHDLRHEFVHGHLVPMPGESKIANRIAINCIVYLEQILENISYEVFAHDVRLMVEPNTIYRYPDVMVAPSSDDIDTHVVTSPILLIEVMSTNSAHTDRFVKLREYRNISSLKHYIVINQEEYAVEVHSQEKDQWQYEVYFDLTETIHLSSPIFTIPMKTIYKKVALKSI